MAGLSRKMELLFATSRVRRLCACSVELTQHLGSEGARAATAQLASLRAAFCLEEFRYLPGRCRMRRGEFRLQLPDGAHIDFEAVGRPVMDATPDWSAIRSIRILRIAKT
jgi:hypothetical protein